MIGELVISGKRIVGIEILRVLSMLLIILLHVLGQGGVLAAASKGSINYYFAWGLEAFAFCAVDTFALISGYVGYGTSHRMSSLVRLCIMSIFFTFTITTGSVICGIQLSLKQLLGSLFPPIIGRYWYLTCYICIYPFMPLFDKLVDELSETKARTVTGILFILVSIIPTIIHNDFAGTKRGYSAAWLAALYIVGAFIRKHGWCHSLKGKRGCGLYIVASVLILGSRIVLEALTAGVFGEPKAGDLFYTYDSPLVVCASVGLLSCFADDRLAVGREETIAFWSSSSFAVFLIHAVPVLYDGPLKNGFGWAARLTPITMCLVCISACIIIYFLSCILDKIRLWLFDIIGIEGIVKRFDDVALRIKL